MQFNSFMTNSSLVLKHIQQREASHKFKLFPTPKVKTEKKMRPIICSHNSPWVQTLLCMKMTHRQPFKGRDIIAIVSFWSTMIINLVTGWLQECLVLSFLSLYSCLPESPWLTTLQTNFRRCHKNMPLMKHFCICAPVLVKRKLPPFRSFFSHWEL